MKPTRTLTWDIEVVATALKVDAHSVREYFTDGRRVAFLIERRIADYIRTNRGRGIQNAAALLIDTRSMDVLAQIGSADFFNAEIQGQVDGTRAPRSPGSTLKPLVYALALEQWESQPRQFRARLSKTDGEQAAHPHPANMARIRRVIGNLIFT